MTFSITSVLCSHRQQQVTFPVALGTTTLGPVRIPTTFIANSLLGVPIGSFTVTARNQTFIATLSTSGNGQVTFTPSTPTSSVTVIRLKCCKRRKHKHSCTSSVSDKCKKTSSTTCPSSTSTTTCTTSSSSTTCPKTKSSDHCRKQKKRRHCEKKSSEKSCPIVKKRPIRKEKKCPKKKEEIVKEIVKKEVEKKKK